ncbi:MAG: YceI family protein [Dehalococcoidia bacterium]|nr:YceI family protein [Dehalococcoidia bacterium]
MTSQSETKKTTWAIDPIHSSVDFAVKHMVIATVRGRFKKFDIDVDFDDAHPEQSRVGIKIDVASIDSREPDRDTHLRSADFFDVEKFPVMTFQSRNIEPKGDGRNRLIGDLTIKDVTREVVLDADLNGPAKDPWGNERFGVTAETSISRKDFGLTWNVALETGGFLVGDSVKIFIEAQLVKQQSG